MEIDGKDREEAKSIYISKDGFVTTKIKRGFYEVEFLYNICKEVKTFVCGGYVRFCCSLQQNPYPASDIDIYTGTEDKYNCLKEKLFSFNLKIKHENEISLTFKRPENIENPFYYILPVQIIKPNNQGAIVAEYDDNIEIILNSFDFTIVRGAILSKKEALMDSDFEHDDLYKILRIKNIHCPISSLQRCIKYSKKGFYLSPMESIKLFKDWENRDDSYRQKLITYLKKANEGKGITQEQIDELEALMRID